MRVALFLALLLITANSRGLVEAQRAVPLPPDPTPPPFPTVIGRSVREMPIVVHQFGDGPMPILLVGGIHGGYEQNTVRLMSELSAHFHAHPEAVAPSASLYIVPAANPDGMLRGRSIKGRFNAHGVDLNRNWGCAWSEEAYINDRRVNPGPAPFSEPETQALRDFIVEIQPVVVVWYHSAADGVFPGACEGERGDHSNSAHMAEILSRATGYPVGEFDAYELTGTASDWVDGLGIPAVALELSDFEETEFDPNLAGVMALQCHFARLAAPGWHVDDLYAFIDRACDEDWMIGE